MVSRSRRGARKAIAAGEERCYFCGEVARTRDHVPPRAFFPKDEDLLPCHVTQRRDLIALPACQAHNGKLSGDDEVAAYVFLTMAASSLAISTFRGRVIRALQRSEGLLARVVKNPKPVIVDGQETVQSDADRPLLDRVFSRVARGVYFHHFNERWNRPDIHVAFDFLRLEGKDDAREHALLEAARAQHFDRTERYGANQNVFYYQVLVENETAFRLCFYQQLNCYAFVVTDEMKARAGQQRRLRAGVV